MCLAYLCQIVQMACSSAAAAHVLMTEARAIYVEQLQCLHIIQMNPKLVHNVMTRSISAHLLQIKLGHMYTAHLNGGWIATHDLLTQSSHTAISLLTISSCIAGSFAEDQHGQHLL